MEKAKELIGIWQILARHLGVFAALSAFLRHYNASSNSAWPEIDLFRESLPQQGNPFHETRNENGSSGGPPLWSHGTLGGDQDIIAGQILNNSPDMVIAADKDRKIVYANRAVELAFGYPVQELLGQPIGLLYANHREGEEVNRKVLAHGGYACRITNQRRNGQQFVSFLSACPLLNQAGEQIGVMGLSREVETLTCPGSLLANHPLFHAALEEHPDSILILDQDKEIQFKNHNAKKIETNLNSIISSLSKEISVVQQSGSPYLPQSFRYLHRFREEERTHCLLPRILALPTWIPGPRGVMLCFQDVTEIWALYEHKTDLMNTLTHELKNPLTSVHNALGILQGQDLHRLSDGQIEWLTIAKLEAQRMMRTLDGLLGLARLEAGLPRLRFELIYPESLVQLALEETAPLARQKSVAVISKISPGLSPVQVDRLRIMIALTNLLANAVKHSPPNEKVEIRAHPLEGDTVSFNILDRGPGIPEQFRDRVFEKFFCVPGCEAAGSGLGLAIAKEFVEAHSGSIQVRPRPGGGSDFSISLPVRQPLLP